MRFEVKHRDTAARSGILQSNDKKVETPNIIFVSAPGFDIPSAAKMVETVLPEKDSDALQIQPLGSIWKKIEKNENADLFIPPYPGYPASMSTFFHKSREHAEGEWFVVSGNTEGFIPEISEKARVVTLANVFSLFQRSSVFVENIVKLREKIGYSRLLHLPMIATPQNLAFLVYMGADLVDSVSAVTAGLNGYLLFPEGAYYKDEVEKGICLCPACNGKWDYTSRETLVQHNYNMLLKELSLVRMAIKKGRLRELVETRAVSSPALMEKLRILHQNHYSFLEKRTPLTKTATLIATSRDAIYYPEVKRFRERVLKWYRKPEGARVLLLLPCSARKPYSSSKSHRVFRDALRFSGNPGVVHEVIVTSPLGLVPRELELVYPAGRYDIPVTNHWYEDEKRMIEEMIEGYLQRNRYDTVISHLPEELHEIVKEKIPDVVSTCVNHPTSHESLRKLVENLKEYVNQFEYVKNSERLKETVRCIAQYQFGEILGSRLVSDEVGIVGSYPSFKVVKDGEQVAAISRERGLLSLTLKGGETLVSAKKNMVFIDKDFQPKGSVLSVGVESADANIIIEDEIVVLQDDELYAVGVARMNGEEMNEMKTGEAVRIRHHR
ncbi:MAG: hypothetical protein DRN01_04985 [Thermoplasmata archaeon]|nr:MAG: hypothetical protein DRN01_04985 [Thermoplasmata archaeon]